MYVQLCDIPNLLEHFKYMMLTNKIFFDLNEKPIF